MAVSSSATANSIHAILTISRAELQQLNFDRIFPELEEKSIIPKGIGALMKSKPANFKANVVKNALEAKGDKEFRTFLDVVAAEDDARFSESNTKFMAMIKGFPEYEEYCLSLESGLLCYEESKTIIHSFVQIGDDSGVFTVGRDGKTHHDSIHGITLHIPSDSLPCGIEQITVTVKVGFSYHELSPDMVMCSATVHLHSVPQVMFTKDVFLKIPHSASSAVTSDLCFVKFKDDVCETGYGEVYNGIFPVDYPYGVIAIKSFSSYVIVRGKRYLNHSSLRKTRLQWSKRKWVHALNKKRKIIPRISSYSDGELCKPTSSSYWLCVSKTSKNNGEIEEFLCVISQCTPTGYQAIQQNYSGRTWEYCMSFSFDLDWLIFHPQSARDCGWSIEIEGYHKIDRSEAERLCNKNGKLRIPVIQYILIADQHELYVPIVTVNVTGADEKLSFDLTLNSPGTESIFKYKLLQCLSARPVVEDKFLLDLACKLPVWQPVAQMLGLTASDIEHIDYDVPAYRGEKAYKAFLQWMQKEGRYCATYDVLLQALCRAKEVNNHMHKSITEAWWFAHQHLSNIFDQPVAMVTDL